MFDVYHTFLSHQATHILRDFAFAVFCNHLPPDPPRLEQDVSTLWWYFNRWCNGNKENIMKTNKLKLETRPTSNIFQHLDLNVCGLTPQYLENRAIVSIHCRLPRWLAMLMPCALPCKQVWQIEDDAPEPKRTEHASLVCYQSCSITYVYCLLFVVYGHRSSCRHPKI